MSDRPRSAIPGRRPVEGAHRGPWPGVFAHFCIAASAQAHFPKDGLPELALAGRSNVGKSSLINAMLGMSKLARTSNTPGRTRSLNFFRIWPRGVPAGAVAPEKREPANTLEGAAVEAAHAAKAFYLVDMPGYGFARVSQATKAAWSKLIESYLRDRERLQGVIQLVDFRHEPTRDDVEMWEWLRHYGKPRLLVATKVDKVGRSQFEQHRKAIVQKLQLGPEDVMLPFSAETLLNREKLWQWVLEHCGV